MTAGVTSTGYVAKTTQEILTEIEQAELSTIDPTLDLSPAEPLGQINGIFSSKLAELWELGSTLYNGFNPDAAEGFLLQALCALTGTKQKSATKSLVSCTVNLDASKTFAPGALMANVSGQTGIKFVNRDTVTSVAAGNYTAVFQAVDYGPVIANAGTLTVITAPVVGWNSITNPADAVTGTNTETETALRQRRQDELTAPGACTTDAIRADLLKVTGVKQAFCFENTSLVTDNAGVPGKAIECVIYDGLIPAAADADVRAVVWNSKPSGIEMYGSISGTVLDSTGASQTVKFSRATVMQIYLTYDVTTNAATFPADGATQIKNAAKALGDKLNMGDDVIALAFRAEALKITGVVDVTNLKLGFSASPVGTANLTIAAREIAIFDTAHIVVNVV